MLGHSEFDWNGMQYYMMMMVDSDAMVATASASIVADACHFMYV